MNKTQQKVLELINSYWKFDDNQQPQSSWHDKQDLLKVVEDVFTEDKKIDPALEAEFETIWKPIWKCKGNRASALSKYVQARKIADYGVLLNAAKKYQAYKDSINAERQYRMGFEVWLNPKNKHWEDIIEVPQKSGYKFGED